jgi:hypothetical protein
MRDPNRIDPFLKAFGEVWKRNPDMRFGQLFMNLSRVEGGFADTWEWEDDKWLASMETFPSAEEIEAMTQERIDEALEIMGREGPDAAIRHLLGQQEVTHESRD